MITVRQNLSDNLFEGLSDKQLDDLVEGQVSWMPSVRQIILDAAEIAQANETQPILRRLYEDEKIVLEETNGLETIPKSREVFSGGVNPRYILWDLDKPSEPTAKTMVAVYEMMQAATFSQMLAYLSLNRDRLVFKQSQIILFVKKHRSRLHPQGRVTFFPLKEGEEFYIASVGTRRKGQFAAGIRQLKEPRVWESVDRRRIVIPQLCS